MFPSDVYRSTGEELGAGAYAEVRTFENVMNHKEYAVKVSTLKQSQIVTRWSCCPVSVQSISEQLYSKDRTVPSLQPPCEY